MSGLLDGLFGAASLLGWLVEVLFVSGRNVFIDPVTVGLFASILMGSILADCFEAIFFLDFRLFRNFLWLRSIGAGCLRLDQLLLIDLQDGLPVLLKGTETLLSFFSVCFHISRLLLCRLFALFDE